MGGEALRISRHDGRSHRACDDRCGCRTDKVAAWSRRSGNGQNRTVLPMGHPGPLRRPAPDFERAGVQITTDLAPWEQAKLRLLNGAHSAMAYLGGLAGIETVDQFVVQPWGRAFVYMLWDELESTLTAPGELNVAEYRRTLMRRFANSALTASASPDRDRRFSEDSAAPRRRRGGSSRARSATRSHCSRDRGVDALAKRPRRSRSGVRRR